MEKFEKIKMFTDLIAWQEAHKIVLMIYKLTIKFPNEEKFGLTSQLRRAAISITSNLAEGFGRGTSKDKIHFYVMAKTSLAEVMNQCITARDLQFLAGGAYAEFDEQAVKVDKLIAGLIKSAKDKYSNT